MAQSPPPAVRHRWPLLPTLLILVGLATAGSPPPAGPGSSTDTLLSRRPPVTLTVLAGSELSDTKLINGAGYDLAWFSTAGYLNLLAQPGGPGRPVATEITMLSPVVVLGVKASVADRPCAPRTSTKRNSGASSPATPCPPATRSGSRTPT